MEAAVAGGVTSLACPPDTDPPLDEPGLVEMLKHRARSLNQAHVYPIGALTVGLDGERADRDGRARPRPAASRSRRPRRRSSTPGPATARCSTRRPSAIACGCAPQEAHLAQRRGRARRRGRDASRLVGDPACRRDDRAGDDLRAGPRTPACACTCAGCRRAEGVAMVRAAKARRPAGDLRCRASIICICATSTSAGSTRNAGWFRRCASTRDRAALRAGLADGTIDLVCSRPHAGRRRRQAAAVRRGGAGRDRPRAAAAADAQVGTRRTASRSSDALARITVGPAAILGHRCRAARRRRARRHLHLRPGAHWRVEPSALKSQGKNTPFLGLEVPGRVRATIVGGAARLRSAGRTVRLARNAGRGIHGRRSATGTLFAVAISSEPARRPVRRPRSTNKEEQVERHHRAGNEESARRSQRRPAQLHRDLLGSGFALAVLPVSAQTMITTSTDGLVAGEVKVPAAGGDMPAYRAMPATGGQFPVVLVVQEVFGVHEHIKDMCRRLREDRLFRDRARALRPAGRPVEDRRHREAHLRHRQQGPRRAGDGRPRCVRRLREGVAARRDTAKLGITGFCWGGRTVLMYAAHNPNVKAAVAWYGPTARAYHSGDKTALDVAGPIKGAVLGLYGGADSGHPERHRREDFCRGQGGGQHASPNS